MIKYILISVILKITQFHFFVFSQLVRLSFARKIFCSCRIVSGQLQIARTADARVHRKHSLSVSDESFLYFSLLFRKYTPIGPNSLTFARCNITEYFKFKSFQFSSIKHRAYNRVSLSFSFSQMFQT